MALTTVPASLSATALTLTTAAQPNITSVGTLTGLTVNGNIAGTLTTAAQPNITSTGTLNALGIAGNLTVDTNTFHVDASNNRVGIGTTNPSSPLTVHGNLRFNTTSGDGDEQRALFNVGGSGDPFSITGYKADASTVGLSLSAGATSYFNGGSVVIGGTTIQGGGLLTLEGPDANMLVLHRTADTGDQEIIFMDHGDHNATVSGKDGGGLRLLTNGRSTTALDLTSGGNVGINNTIASTFNASANNLVIGSGASGDNTGLTIYSNSNASGSIHFADAASGTDSYVGDIYYNHNDDFMAFLTGATEKMRIEDYNIGIAKSSLATYSSGYRSLQIGGRGFIAAHSGSDLYIGQNAYFDSAWKYEASVAASYTQHSGGQIEHYVAGAGTAGNAISWINALKVSPSGGVTINNGQNNNINFTVKSGSVANALVVDGQSGRLMVAKGSSSFGTVGHELDALGQISTTADGRTTVYLNRLSSHGKIIQFHNGGTEQGSINTKDGDIAIGTEDTGLRFIDGSDAITPHNITGNAGRSDAIDLGTSGARFKDIYVGGGILLSGTGASNRLENFQDITLMGYQNNSGGVQLYKGSTLVSSSYNARYGYYARVGNLIFVSFYFYVNSGSCSASGEYRIYGIPFNLTSGSTAAYQSIQANYLTMNGTNIYNSTTGNHRWQANSTTYLSLYGNYADTNWTSSLIEFAGSGVLYIN